MKTLLGTRVGLVLLLIAIAAVATVGVSSAQVPKERVLIGFVGLPGPDDAAAVRAAGGVIRASYVHLPVLAAELPSTAVARLQRNPRVRYIEPDQLRYAIVQSLPWGVDRIGADDVWHISTGLGVNVAMLDTGGDNDHPDLAYAGGINFAGWLRDGRTDAKSWDDGNGHGTWTSGIVAALNNDIGVVGVAPDAFLWAVKVLSNSGSGWDSDIAQGIDWAISAHMDVISMSLGGAGYSLTLEQACQRAWDAGIVTVAAAGNEGDGNPDTEEISYPAAFETVIAVGATDSQDALASWSNTGGCLELVAPGVSVESTYKGGGYQTFSGTSGACPHVSGVAALLRSANPALTGAEVRSILSNTAHDLGPAGWDPGFGYGIVDAVAALGLPPQPVEYDAAVTSITADPTSLTIGGTVSISVVVANNGIHQQTVEVTVTESPDDEELEPQYVTLLAGETATLGFSWDTSGNTIGDHTITATVALPGDERPSNNSRSVEVTLTDGSPAGLTVTITPDKGDGGVYTRGQSVYLTVLTTDAGVPQSGIYNFVEVLTASGNVYLGEGYTGSDGTSVYWFKPNPSDGYGNYLATVLAYTDDLVAAADDTTFSVKKK